MQFSELLEELFQHVGLLGVPWQALNIRVVRVALNDCFNSRRKLLINGDLLPFDSLLAAFVLGRIVKEMALCRSVTNECCVFRDHTHLLEVSVIVLCFSIDAVCCTFR